MKINIFKKGWFFFGGVFFILWGLTNTYLGIERYGLASGEYLWFCNIALFAIGFALVVKSPKWIVSFLAAALISQTFWIADNIFRLLTKKNLFGVVEFMYQPGYPMDEFIVSHYHIFVIPTALLSLFFLNKKRYNTIPVTIGVGLVVFALSPFFPYERNVNCSKAPCFNGMPDYGIVYQIVFPLVFIAANTMLAVLLKNIHLKMNPTRRVKNFAVGVYIFTIALSTAMIYADVHYKESLPSFKCAKPYENDGVRISCKYTSEIGNNRMLLSYNVENMNAKKKNCISRINIANDEHVMQDNIILEPFQKHTLKFEMPYPQASVIVNLSINCN